MVYVDVHGLIIEEIDARENESEENILSSV